MKVCIPIEGTLVSQHFGHTPEFLIVTIEDGKVVSRKVEKSPGHEPGLLPKLMASWGVTHVITGGLGKRALDMFNERNIAVISGIQGPAEQALQAFLGGKLVAGENLCDH
jgi:predicted Fe-Mo cluster-binding NifX family protein